jgi:murein DD-endopeptidase MepM/ murein hydrolase activator NlpD
VFRAGAAAPPPDLPPYQVYVVQDGDTLSSIAARHGIGIEYVTANNPGIHDANALLMGQALIIPAGNGILHEVRYGETLSDIAARYDVPLDTITGFSPNRIASANEITETQLVYVPNGRPPVFEAPVEDAGELTEPAGEPVLVDSGESDDGDVSVLSEDEDDGTSVDSSAGSGQVAAASASGGLIWPVYGPISSPYGGGHPLGIDIDGFNLGGAGVAAATEGTVVFAGGNACCSYGLYVVVQSPGGIETLYAHLSSISVSQGEYVSQGQGIGVIGSTGYSTGVHLHFEVIDNGVRQNPVSYLP